MKKYTVYLKDRSEPITFQADSVEWILLDSKRDPVAVPRMLFKAGNQETALVILACLQAFTVE